MKLSYQAFDKTGKPTRDTIEAVDTDDAREQLRRRGFYVTQIGGSPVVPAPILGPKTSRGGSRTKRLKHLAMFAQQMYVLISSGTRVVESLEAIEQQIKDEQWRRVVVDIRKHIEQGASLAEATQLHPQYFDMVSQNLISAGEATGKLPLMLERLAKLTQGQIKVRTALAGAMVYPALLMFVAVGVLSMMLMFVLPRFSSLFETLDVPLPPTTKFLVVLSDTLRAYWWVILLALAGGMVGLKMWFGTESGKQGIDMLMVRLPHLGKVTRNFSTARIARLLGIMLDSYMPLLDVLGLVRQAMGNMYYVKLLANAEEAVTRGESISSAFSSSDLINPSVCQVVRAGEQSGQVAPLLLNVADMMDEENNVLVKSLMSIVEPLILIILGVLVGFVALSMFMPLFDLMGSSPGASG